MSGSWIDDGSNSLETDGSTVICKGTEPGSPSNALFKDQEIVSGSSLAYWTLQFLEVEEGSGPFVGLTSEEKFGKGWAIQGYLYGGPGNTSNGGAGLINGFGESIKSGDTIGVLADAGADRLQIYYFHNGRPLGLAFDLPQPYLTPLFPCISFGGKGKVVAKRESEIPTEKSRKDAIDQSSIVGNWELTSSPLSDSVSGINASLILKQTKNPNEYSGQLNIINQINLVLKKGETTWEIQIGSSTKMGGTPEVMAFEGGIVKLLGQVKSVELEGGQLKCKGEDDGVHLWARKVKEFPPTTTFP